ILLFPLHDALPISYPQNYMGNILFFNIFQQIYYNKFTIYPSIKYRTFYYFFHGLFGFCSFISVCCSLFSFFSPITSSFTDTDDETFWGEIGITSLVLLVSSKIHL